MLCKIVNPLFPTFYAVGTTFTYNLLTSFQKLFTRILWMMPMKQSKSNDNNLPLSLVKKVNQHFKLLFPFSTMKKVGERK